MVKKIYRYPNSLRSNEEDSNRNVVLLIYEAELELICVRVYGNSCIIMLYLTQH